MKDIKNLIPHREPFLFVDELISANKEEITGSKRFAEEECFFLRQNFGDLNFIPGMIILESMAQCGGAGIRFLNLAKGLFGLISLENVNFFKGVEIGENVQYVIQNLKISGKIIKQKGIAYVDNVKVAEATWMCARLD